MEKAYGGVLINGQGLVLLREPANHFGNYVWTFAKGRPTSGESPEAAALREVLEETGIRGEIVVQLPGPFRGCLTLTEFFLMRPVEDTRHFCWETRSVCWATEAEAKELLAQSPNLLGRARDLQVLSLAFGAFRMTASAASIASYVLNP